MKFLCGSCRTKYQISDEKVRGKILTIRCKKCGAKILVRESLARDAGGGTAVAPVAEEERTAEATQSAQAQQSSGRVARMGGSAALASAYDVAMGGGASQADDMPTSIAPVPANLEVAGVEWYVAIDGVQHGPFAFAEVVEKLRRREVIGRHYVWHDGMDNWSRVRDVDDLKTYLPPPKKKPPPVPPPSVETNKPRPAGRGAEVVDIASKRAERARGQLGTSPVDDVSDSDATAVESAGPLADAAAHTTSDRAEQLDSVLNEALGIEGEGRTTQEQPEGAGRRRGHRGRRQDTDDRRSPRVRGEGRGHLRERPARGRRGSAHPRVDALLRRGGRREREAQAKPRRRRGGRDGRGDARAVHGDVGDRDHQHRDPGIGNPFASGSDDKDELALADGEAADGDFEYLLVGKQKKKVRRRRRPKRPKRSASGGGYITDEGGTGSRGTRGGGGPESVGIQLPGGGPGGAVGVGRRPAPEHRHRGHPAAGPGGGLTPDDIKRVIAARKGAVQTCFERSLRAQEDLGGKIEFRVTVEPSGKVSKATVDTTAFSGSKLGNCVAKKIKTWRFPSFTGESQQILVPFILARNSY